MSLPFAKDQKKKYTCFVCGRGYEDFEVFKTHIVEKHEETKDYVLCPLERCKTPVRDLKLHFKARHPSETMPKFEMAKAMIWRDHNPKSKKRKPQFREGWMVSLKNNGKEFHYRSGLECQIFECLEVIDEVETYDVEPFKQGIPYLFEGEMHNYFPDASVKYIDGHVEIWEIKPSSQTALAVNQAKWGAAEAYCATRGWEFIVITEKGLEKLKNLARKNIFTD